MYRSYVLWHRIEGAAMTSDAPKNGKKVFRSPNHPAFDLTQAISKIGVIYQKEKRSSTTAQIIAKHMGYSHINGPGGRALSGLRQYGLLEEVQGQYKISELAFSILHYPEGSQERLEAIKKAAVTPTLYRELREQYPDGASSDDTLRANLLKRSFNPAVLENVIQDYRSTMALAGLMDVSYTDLREGDKMTSAPIGQNMPPGIQTYSFALSPNSRAELSLRGTITPEDLELLRDHVELTIKALARTAAKEAPKK